MAFRNVAYVNTNSTVNVQDALCFQLPDGQLLFGVVCIFAANMNGDDPNNPSLWFNSSVNDVLTTNIDQVRALQESGIAVLLTVLPNHQNAGWSNFTEQSAAQAFAAQLADAVAEFGLDGIDIDDEYSTGTPNDTSLIMVTYEMQQAMPGKIVSKALFADWQYFASSWEGHTLAENLTYGWEMSYGDPDYKGRLQPYLEAGMPSDALGLGVNCDGGTDEFDAAQYVAANDVGGIMVYDVTKDSAGFLNGVAEGLYREPITVPPDCLQ